MKPQRGTTKPLPFTAPYERVKRMVVSGGIELEYQVLGNWSALERVVVLVSDIGNLGVGNVWSETVFVRALRANGCTVVRFNMRDSGGSTHHYGGATEPGLERLARGCGLYALKTSRPCYTANDLADDLVEVLGRLCIDACHIVGYGFGGVIGRLVLLSHPRICTSLTTIATPATLFWPPGRAALLDTDAKAAAPPPLASEPLVVKARYLADRARLCFAAGAEYNRATLTEMYYQCLASIPEHGPPSRCALMEYEAATARQEWAFHSIDTSSRAKQRLEALRHSRKPMLVVHGKADPCVPAAVAKDLADTLPSAQLLLVEGAKHEMSDTHSPVIAQHVVRMIAHVSTAERSRRATPMCIPSPLTPGGRRVYAADGPERAVDARRVRAYHAG